MSVVVEGDANLFELGGKRIPLVASTRMYRLRKRLVLISEKVFGSELKSSAKFRKIKKKLTK